MTKQFTLNLDAVIVIAFLFLASFAGNIFLAWDNSNIGKQLIDTQAELVISELNLMSKTQERDKCMNDLKPGAQQAENTE